MKLNKYWFKPKIYGYGAYPTTLEGWIFTAFFIILVFVISLTFAGDNKYFFTSLILLILIFVYICKIKTEGKWAWRWGNK